MIYRFVKALMRGGTPFQQSQSDLMSSARSSQFVETYTLPTTGDPPTQIYREQLAICYRPFRNPLFLVSINNSLSNEEILEMMRGKSESSGIFSMTFLPQLQGFLLIECVSAKAITNVFGWKIRPEQIQLLDKSQCMHCFCAPIRCLACQPGKIVRVVDHEFVNEAAQIVDIDNTTGKMVLKLYPHIDYEGLLAENLTSQQMLNMRMGRNYRPTPHPFDESGLRRRGAKMQETQLRIGIAPGGVVPAVVWDENAYIGKFMYMTDIPMSSILISDLKITEQEFERFEQGVAPFEMINEAFMTEMMKTKTVRRMQTHQHDVPPPPPRVGEQPNPNTEPSQSKSQRPSVIDKPPARVDHSSKSQKPPVIRELPPIDFHEPEPIVSKPVEPRKPPVQKKTDKLSVEPGCIVEVNNIRYKVEEIGKKFAYVSLEPMEIVGRVTAFRSMKKDELDLTKEALKRRKRHHVKEEEPNPDVERREKACQADKYRVMKATQPIHEPHTTTNKQVITEPVPDYRPRDLVTMKTGKCALIVDIGINSIMALMESGEVRAIQVNDIKERTENQAMIIDKKQTKICINDTVSLNDEKYKVLSMAKNRLFLQDSHGGYKTANAKACSVSLPH